MTVRIDVDTHGALMDTARDLNLTTGATIAALLRHYRSKLRHEEAARQLRELKADPVAWAEFLGSDEDWPELKTLPTKDAT